MAVACEPASGATFALGATSVSCTATDAAGSVARGTFTVTVVDTTPPVLSLPANITTSASSTAGVPVSYLVLATDLVAGPLAASCSPASGATFPIGVTTVTCTATDPAGNVRSGSFTVTVTLDAAPRSAAGRHARVHPGRGRAGTSARSPFEIPRLSLPRPCR